MGAVTGLAILLACTFVSIGAMYLVEGDLHPGEKRTYIFETADGDRYNPFSGELRDVKSDDPICGSCGAPAESGYTFCGRCAQRM